MRANRTLVLVLGLLLLPFAVAGTLYAVGWHPAGTGNHGELLSPPRALPPYWMPRVSPWPAAPPPTGAWWLPARALATKPAADGSS